MLKSSKPDRKNNWLINSVLNVGKYLYYISVIIIAIALVRHCFSCVYNTHYTRLTPKSRVYTYACMQFGTEGVGGQILHKVHLTLINSVIIRTMSTCCQAYNKTCLINRFSRDVRRKKVAKLRRREWSRFKHIRIYKCITPSRCINPDERKSIRIQIKI